MSYCGYITKIKNLHKHSNADRLLCGECFGNNVIVSLDYTEGQLGFYLPTDGKLGVEFAEKNNLLRKKDENGKSIGGYMDEKKRNVTAVKLRGEKSDGLFLPLESLKDFTDITKLKEGDTITVLNGVVICEKYIPIVEHHDAGVQNKKKNKVKKPTLAPLFEEHIDTQQLAFNLPAFKNGDEIEITLKMHGTSQRTGFLPVFKRYKRSFLDFIFRSNGKPIYEYDYIDGTRRCVLSNYDGGFYGSNEFREPHADRFKGKLYKGETVYYEVVGFINETKPIMGSVNNKLMNDKEFVNQYGEKTVFSYGCSPTKENGLPQSELYVYRMTMTNEDGEIVEYPPYLIRYRCEQMGINVVPVLSKFVIPDGVNAGEYVRNIAEGLVDGADPIGKNHIREGVVCRIVNRPKFTAYKHKSFAFRVLEGLAKANADAPDIEEIQEIQEV